MLKNTYLIELFCTYIGTQKTWLAPSVCPISDQALIIGWSQVHLYNFPVLIPCGFTISKIKQIRG